MGRYNVQKSVGKDPLWWTGWLEDIRSVRRNLEGKCKARHVQYAVRIPLFWVSVRALRCFHVFPLAPLHFSS